MIISKRSKTQGTTLTEATVAAFVSVLILGALFTINLSSMKTIRTAREATSASQILQQRVEAMRIANWQQVTNADWVKANLLNGDANGSSGLNTMSETLTLAPYSAGAESEDTTASTQLVRSGGTTQIVNRNTNLLKEHAMKVVWTVAYNGGVNGRTTTRQAVAVLAKGGVAKW